MILISLGFNNTEPHNLSKFWNSTNSVKYKNWNYHLFFRQFCRQIYLLSPFASMRVSAKFYSADGSSS